jgi:cytoskeletal protein CcmA (bactofilin family)
MERSGDMPARTRAGGVLSSGVSIDGDVTFGAELVIDGEIKGNVTSTGTLTIGEHARIFGKINVGSVTVHGTVQGNISASERCTLAAGASLRGDITAPRLVVDESAAFLGSARITANRS